MVPPPPNSTVGRYRGTYSIRAASWLQTGWVSHETGIWTFVATGEAAGGGGSGRGLQGIRCKNHGWRDAQSRGIAALSSA